MSLAAAKEAGMKAAVKEEIKNLTLDRIWQEFS